MPAAQPAPSAAPPYAYAPPAPVPAYGSPPPGYYNPYPPPVAPQSAPAPAPPPAPMGGPERGLYVSARGGIGAPFGGNTTVSGGYSEGGGILGELGYAIVPNFGLNAFLHYNFTSLTTNGEFSSNLDGNSGHVLLYGAEARGIAGAGPFIGWLSLGFSLGTGNLSLHETQGGGGLVETSGSANDVTFGVMPVLGFGAEVAVLKGLYLGPEVRWYVTNASRACSQPDVPEGSTFISMEKRCTSDFGDVTVPDVVFVGIGATYRIDFIR